MTARSDTPMWSRLIPLVFEGRMSLQAQIREMLTGAILDGRLPTGVALPSTRELSQQLGVARNTVALAYELLVDEGYLVTRNRSGHYVNPEIVAGRAAPPQVATASTLPQASWASRIPHPVGQ
nr:winged helix-turn-helix transcriptional regulator [Burkholderiales bacterium]